jgi:predicted DNA-binding WGR domain protein
MAHSVHLVRCDSSRNMARFYRLELSLTLFGEMVLIRRWGRIGTEGRRQESLLADPSDGMRSLQEWRQKKQRRGYRAV